MTDEEGVIIGVPTMCLLPANYTRFKVVDEVKLSISRRGEYVDIAPELFDTAEGGFNVLTEEGVLYLPSITKILFAEKKYPKLATNQIFAPSIIVFKDDTVFIEGYILELLEILAIPK